MNDLAGPTVQADGDLSKLYTIEISFTPTHHSSRHADIELCPGADQYQQGRGYTLAQVLASWRWASGVMSRVALLLVKEINYDPGEYWGNAPERRTFDQCAFASGENLTIRAHAYGEDDCPYVGIGVPDADGRAEEWYARAQQLLAEVLTADQEPAPSDSAALVASDHGALTPYDPHHQHGHEEHAHDR